MTLMERIREDDGVSAILVCIFIVFLTVPVAAVSVDLSNAYSNRRQMQNAADAASQAGAQQMDAVKRGTALPSTLATLVDKVAAANDADTSSADYSCNVATVTYDPVTVTAGPTCANWTGDTSYNAVTVHTQRDVDTFFAGAIAGGGSSSTSATATATATIQKVSDPNLGNAVFAMCAFATVGKKGATDTSWIPMLVSDDTGLVSLNDAAIGQRYVVWSNAGGNSNLSRCGLQSASFDGRICGMAPDCTQPITFPADGSGSWLSISTGAQVGPTLALMAGYPACDPSLMTGSTHPDFSPCAMVLPVCDSSNVDTGSNGELHCLAFGEFLLSPGDQDSTDSSCTFITGSSDTICGEFLGPPVLADGTPVSGDPQNDDPRRVALVQ